MSNQIRPGQNGVPDILSQESSRGKSRKGYHTEWIKDYSLLVMRNFFWERSGCVVNLRQMIYEGGSNYILPVGDYSKYMGIVSYDAYANIMYVTTNRVLSGEERLYVSKEFKNGELRCTYVLQPNAHDRNELCESVLERASGV